MSDGDAEKLKFGTQKSGRGIQEILSRVAALGETLCRQGSLREGRLDAEANT